MSCYYLKVNIGDTDEDQQTLITLTALQDDQTRIQSTFKFFNPIQERNTFCLFVFAVHQNLKELFPQLNINRGVLNLIHIKDADAMLNEQYKKTSPFSIELHSATFLFHINILS